MAVNTGVVVHATHFDVPAGIELGSTPAKGIGSDLPSATVFPPTVSTCLVINAILCTAITPIAMTANGGSGGDGFARK